ncbi:hypothetical protein SAMN05518672_10590 [Chitinophaga sp. CF118]|uniref:hypothetical protein n=1 Tax=Chitinophaga sp. CF118 TaxID=1884367 RepID=UPI0008EB668D|nr:hypothetical protein [Chitinophaga sp. CF118]SFE26202.1 hypothetical protein SAMN05518672_10590 [Chitinophaga sp. CF118]
MKKAIKLLFERILGVKLLSREGQKSMGDYISVLEGMISNYGEKAEGISCVVFSKNRAIQLHALIKSYFKYVENPCPIFVLYSADGVGQLESYEQLNDILKERNLPVTFIRENNFRTNLVDLLSLLDTKNVFFLVDDIVFIRQMNLKDWENFDTKKYIPSIRLGENINYSYANQHVQKVPVLEPTGKDLFLWNWADGEYDWKYPLSVDGNIFSLAEILSLIKSISFNAPNSLERELQCGLQFYMKKKGVTYRYPRIVNNPCNRVQSEIDNPSGNVSIEFLLDEWEKGNEIDIDLYDDIATNSVHQELVLTFKKRES